MARMLITKGNHKLGTDGAVYCFNLPAVSTCAPTKWCLEGKDGEPSCYALNGRFKWPNVKDAYEWRYEESLKSDFAGRVIDEINKVTPQFFRWHVSGDFYNEEYIGKVEEIVIATPNVLHRTTTRRRDFAKAVLQLNSQPNMIIRESLDTVFRNLTLGLPFAAIDSIDIINEMDATECKEDCIPCEYSCWKEPVNMYFKEK